MKKSGSDRIPGQMTFDQIRCMKQTLSSLTREQLELWALGQGIAVFACCALYGSDGLLKTTAAIDSQAEADAMAEISLYVQEETIRRLSQRNSRN